MCVCVSNWRQHQQMSTQSVPHISKRRCVPFSSSTIIVVSIESTELQRQRTGPLGCALVVVPVVVVVVVVVVDVGWFAFLACQQRSSPELFLPHLWQSLGHLSVRLVRPSAALFPCQSNANTISLRPRAVYLELCCGFLAQASETTRTPSPQPTTKTTTKTIPPSVGLSVPSP